MNPETKARQQIDKKRERAGWVVQGMRQRDLAVTMGVAVREFPTDTGPADYVLFVDRQAVGMIEAKRNAAGETLVARMAPGKTRVRLSERQGVRHEN